MRPAVAVGSQIHGASRMAQQKHARKKETNPRRGERTRKVDIWQAGEMGMQIKGMSGRTTWPYCTAGGLSTDGDSIEPRVVLWKAMKREVFGRLAEGPEPAQEKTRGRRSLETLQSTHEERSRHV